MKKEEREKQNAENMEALKEFLLHIDCLDPLSEWTSKFNLFDVLKISRAEIRHSNMLAWLLNPNENHGLSDGLLRGIIQYYTVKMNDRDVLRNLLIDCHDFVILREWHHIDLLAVSENKKYVICIENKIDSGEHDNQLNRYRKHIKEYYPDYKQMYIFLSPDGVEASDPENWCSMGYEDVLTIIENLRRKTKLLPDVELLIDNYIETIRRDIVGDENLKKICEEIYIKHQKALDLIFENRPNKASVLAEVLFSWAREKSEDGLIDFVEDKSSNTYVRFKTKTMSEILPDIPDTRSGWNTENHYFYEIRNTADGNDFYIQLALSAKEMTDEQKKVCEQINQYYPSRHQKEDWLWRAPFATKHARTDDEMSEEKIRTSLDKQLEEVLTFEDKLKKILFDIA